MTITLNKAQLIGILGSILLLIGVFLPIVQIPIVGSIALFVGLKSYGSIVFVLAVLSIFLITYNQAKILLLAGTIALSIILYNLYRTNEYVSRIQDKAEGQINDGIFGGLAAAMSQSVKLEFGWLFLIAGSICILLAATTINKENRVENFDTERTKITSSGMRGFLFFLFMLLLIIGGFVLSFLNS